MKAYAVSSGSYSDYHILALFERRESAEAWIERQIPLDLARRKANLHKWLEQDREELAKWRAKPVLIGVGAETLGGQNAQRAKLIDWYEKQVSEREERVREGLTELDRRQIEGGYYVEEFDYYPGQELPAPGFIEGAE